VARATLTRRVGFSATHRYHRPEWSEARNREAFGDCAAPEPHGHAYVCDVSVRGAVDATTGMVMDLGVLDRILAAEVISPLRGACVNDAYPEFAPGGRIPTCEELAGAIAARVNRALADAGVDARATAVRVAEDDTLSATWTPDP
jgi:6-pyruvoyltetrahydropterin/6-carboxytetrahydropterin synthase